MLNSFTFFTINEIFNKEAKHKLTASERMLYINCLMHHFKDKEPKLENLNEFELFIDKIPSFKKFKPSFVNLEKANLVWILDDRVMFKNVWSPYISISKMLNKTVEHKTYLAEDFTDEMYNSHELFDLCGMKHKVTKAQTNKLLQIFFAEQATVKQRYNDEGACRKHFVYWIASNKDKTTQETVKSTGKILGQK